MSLKLCFLVIALLLPSSLGFNDPSYEPCINWCISWCGYGTDKAADCIEDICDKFRMVRRGDPEAKLINCNNQCQHGKQLAQCHNECRSEYEKEKIGVGGPALLPSSSLGVYSCERQCIIDNYSYILAEKCIEEKCLSEYEKEKREGNPILKFPSVHK